MFRRAFLLAPAAALAADAPLQGLRPSHPRLILTNEGLDRLRQVLRTDPHAQSVLAAVKEEAEKILTQDPVIHKLEGPRLLTQSRRALARIYTLALVWRLDGDERFLRRAVKELEAAANFPDWNPSHFLDTAEMTHAFAIGYDWLHAKLSDAEKKWIRAAIEQKGFAPGLQVYESGKGWPLNRFNWNQVCNGGLGIGALALANEDMLRRAVRSMPVAMASYAPDGAWPEGPGYWHYATRYTVHFLSALETALGHDFKLSESTGFDQAGRFRIHCCGPSGHTFNYADASPSIGSAAEMMWLARRFRNPVYAWHQRQVLEHKMSPDPLHLIWYSGDQQSPQQAAWPANIVFEGVQVAFLRSGWDGNATWLGIKAGSNKVGHSHLDLGTFVLDAHGVRWALDFPGDNYNLPQYFGKLRWTYYRLRTESHNTLSLDGGNQSPDADTKMIRRDLTARAPFVTLDLAPAWPGQANKLERTARLEKDGVLIEDVLEAAAPVEAVWGMTTPAEVNPSGRTAALMQNGKRIAARIESPNDARFEVVSTRPPAPQNQNEGTRRLVVRLPGKVQRTRIAVRLTTA